MKTEIKTFASHRIQIETSVPASGYDWHGLVEKQNQLFNDIVRTEGLWAIDLIRDNIGEGYEVHTKMKIGTKEHPERTVPEIKEMGPSDITIAISVTIAKIGSKEDYDNVVDSAYDYLKPMIESLTIRTLLIFGANKTYVNNDEEGLGDFIILLQSVDF